MHVLTPYIVSCVIIYMFGSVYACEFLMDKGFQPINLTSIIKAECNLQLYGCDLLILLKTDQ
jgi:hypothetical protein